MAVPGFARPGVTLAGKGEDRTEDIRAVTSFP